MPARIRRTTVATAIAVSVAVTASGCIGGSSPEPPTSSPIVELPAREVASPVELRLAEGLVPPTNRWFSGLVFGDAPQPVFPFPLSFALTDSGFSFGLPQVEATPTTIFGGMNAAITVDAAATAAVVTGYDAVSVTIALLGDDGTDIGEVSIAEGRPDVTFTAARPVTLRMDRPFEPASDLVWRTSTSGAEYGVVAPDGAVSDDAIELTAGESAQWFATPEDRDTATFAALIGSSAERVDVTYDSDGATVSTRLEYGDTAVVAPDGVDVSTACDLGTYATAYGRVQVCAGGVLEWTVPLVEASAALDLDGIEGATRERIASAAADDVAATEPPPADTYFGAKWMYRLANLALVARAVGAEDAAAGAERLLKDELSLWTDPAGCEERDHRCFEYDPALHGVVGLQPAFGSEEFNDHHFHYGYLIHAAAVAVQLDPSLAEHVAPVVDALVADIAAPVGGGKLPQRRVFDPYTGHSWASGFSPFADGNNQESSSEAIMAWNAVVLWSELRGDRALAAEATWLLSAEASAARARWLEPDLANLEGFEHEIVSINWGGKRDYATWFSAEPNAILGIQLIPMGPVMATLPRDPQRVDAAVREAAAGGYHVQFGDYLLMYRALAGETDAAESAEESSLLPDAAIDDANSRAYLAAWFAALGAPP